MKRKVQHTVGNFSLFKKIALNIQVWVTLARNSNNVQMPCLLAFMMFGSQESTLVHFQYYCNMISQ